MISNWFIFIGVFACVISSMIITVVDWFLLPDEYLEDPDKYIGELPPLVDFLGGVQSYAAYGGVLLIALSGVFKVLGL